MNKYPGFDRQLAESLDKAIETLARTVQEQRRSCLTCCHFDEAAEGCQKANGARPPAKVIALGCPAHERDDIPF